MITTVDQSFCLCSVQHVAVTGRFFGFAQLVQRVSHDNHFANFRGGAAGPAM